MVSVDNSCFMKSAMEGNVSTLCGASLSEMLHACSLVPRPLNLATLKSWEWPRPGYALA